MDLQTIFHKFASDLGPLEEIYKDIHQHPELSRCESRTASVVATYLRHLNLDVHEHIGGHGIVAILTNGPGLSITLRAELDALPIKEQTGLPYESTEYMADLWGLKHPVMHACGHDMHMACLMAHS